MNKKLKITLIIIPLIILLSGIILLLNSKKEIIQDNKFSGDLSQINSNDSFLPNNSTNIESYDEKYFFGTVIESNLNSIIVEPFENESIRKSSDKISLNLGEYNDALYQIGTNLKITYSGDIMETYPAQIHWNNIEIKSTDNFELRIYDKMLPPENNTLLKIIDENDSEKYSYSVFYYNCEVNIIIDGIECSLKEALDNNKITISEIIQKANNDVSSGIITMNTYRDGGSVIYHYDNYELIKMHTLDGNRDFIIARKGTNINEVNN